MVANPNWITMEESEREVLAYNPDAPAFRLIEVLSARPPIYLLTDLPTEDPLVDNALWNDTGTPSLSAGPPQ